MGGLRRARCCVDDCGAGLYAFYAAWDRDHPDDRSHPLEVLLLFWDDDQASVRWAMINAGTGVTIRAEGPPAYDILCPEHGIIDRHLLEAHIEQQYLRA